MTSLTGNMVGVFAFSVAPKQSVFTVKITNKVISRQKLFLHESSFSLLSLPKSMVYLPTNIFRTRSMKLNLTKTNGNTSLWFPSMALFHIFPSLEINRSDIDHKKSKGAGTAKEPQQEPGPATKSIWAKQHLK